MKIKDKPAEELTEGEIREEYLAIREAVLKGTATVKQVRLADDLLEWMRLFQRAREHEPKPL
jgi:hypothetical protein